MSVTSPLVQPFASLGSLQTEHTRLQAAVAKQARGPDIYDQITSIVRRAVLTGASLDRREERQSAQAIINYWVSRGASLQDESEGSSNPFDDPEFDSLLEEFDPATLLAATDAVDRWLASSPEDESLIRSIILRLLRLRDDDIFEVISRTESEFEDLEPRDRTQQVLSLLTTLGVIRTTSCSSGGMEFALRSPALIDQWPQLQNWMQKRRQFRKIATESAKHKAGGVGESPIQSPIRRFRSTLKKRMLKAGIWIERCCWTVLAKFNIRRATEKQIPEEEYDKAETYRDLNAVELKLIYQKRQLDKERYEAGQVIVVLLATAAVGLTILVGIALRSAILERRARTTAEKQKSIAEVATAQAEIAGQEESEAKGRALQAEVEAKRARKEADLQIASSQLEQGAQLMLSRDRDISGALLYSANAFCKFESSADSVEDQADQARLRANYLIRLGVAQRQSPTLRSIAYQDQIAASACSLNGQRVLTVKLDKKNRSGPAVATIWHTNDQDTWVPHSSSWTLPSDEVSDVTGAYLSEDGSTGVVTVKCRDESSKAYVKRFDLSGNFLDSNDHSFGLPGTLKNAALSQNGKWFAAVTLVSNKALETESSSSSFACVSLWRDESWDKEIRLNPSKTEAPPTVVAAEDPQDAKTAMQPWSDKGVPDVLVFNPQSDRLALTTRPNLKVSDGKRVVCLEWKLDSIIEAERSKVPVRPAEYTGTVPTSSFQEAEEKTFAAYGPVNKDQQVLFVASGREDSPPNLWLFNSKLESHPQELPLETFAHAAPIMHASFARSGDRIATAGADDLVNIWSLEIDQTSRRVRTRSRRAIPHDLRVFWCDFSSDGRYLATASRDRAARVWDLNTLQLAHPSLQHSGSVDLVKFRRDGRQLITSSQNITYCWDLLGGDAKPLLVSGTLRQIQSLAVDPEGTFVLGAGSKPEGGGWAQVWDTQNGMPRTPTLPHLNAVHQVAISPANTGYFSTIDSVGAVRIWDVKKPNRPAYKIESQLGRATHATFGKSPDGVLLLTVHRKTAYGNQGGTNVCVWSIGAKDQPTQIGSFDDEHLLTSAIFSPNCKRVVAFTGEGSDGVALLWEVGPKNNAVRLKQDGLTTAHLEPITSAVFSSSEDRLVTTSADNSAIVWFSPKWQGRKLEGREKKEEIEGHTADVITAAFDNQGRRVVTAGADRQAIVWEMNIQNEYRPIVALNLGAPPLQILFSPDPEQRYILGSGHDSTTRIWDAKDGRVIATKQYPGPVRHIMWKGHKPEGAEEGLNALVIGLHLSEESRGHDSSNNNLQFNIATPLSRIMLSEWDLSHARTTNPQTVMQMAEVTAGRRLVKQQDMIRITPLSLLAIQENWGEWSKTASFNNQVSDWHAREASWSESTGQWEAACSHLDRAICEIHDAKSLAAMHTRRAMVNIQSAESRSLDQQIPYAHDNEWKAALEDLSEAMKFDENDRDLLLARANALSRLERYSDAVKDYESVLRMDPEDSFTITQLGDTYKNLGKPEDAAEQYDRALKIDDANPDLYFKRAEIRANPEGRNLAAASEDYLIAARLFKQRGQFDGMENAFNKLVDLSAHSAEITPKRRAEIYTEFAQAQEARALWAGELQRQNIYQRVNDNYLKATKLDAETRKYWVGLANSYRLLKDVEKAIEAYEQALKCSSDGTNQDTLGLSINLVESLVQTKNWAKAAEIQQKIVELQLNVPSHRLRLAAIILQPQMPNKEIQPDQFEKAQQSLTDAVQKIPESSMLWDGLATVQLMTGKTEEYQATRSAMFEAIETVNDPTANDKNGVAWAAVFLSDTSAGAEKAVRLAEAAIAELPSDSSFLNTYGAALCRAGKWDQAIAKLQEATKQRVQSQLTPEMLAYGNAFDLLFIALAEKGRGNTVLAGKLLESADTQIKLVEPARATENPRITLDRAWERMEYQIIRRDVEKQLKH